jgi:hypothetical protein
MLKTGNRGRLRTHTQSTLARFNDITIFGRLLDTPGSTSPLNDPTSQVHIRFDIGSYCCGIVPYHYPTFFITYEICERLIMTFISGVYCICNDTVDRSINH